MLRTRVEPPLPVGTAQNQPLMMVDETYLHVPASGPRLYRAVDSTGATIDFLLSTKRDATAAKTLFPESIAVPLPGRPSEGR